MIIKNIFPFKLLLVTTAIIGLLTGCSTSNKFASSFGKRRYTKGHYFDLAGNKRNTDKLVLTEPKPLKTAEIEPKQALQIPSNAAIAKTEPIFISVIRGKHSSKLNNQPPISRISKAPKVLTTDKQQMVPISQTTAAGDITPDKPQTVKYTDYGIRSTFATVIWIFLACFIWALKLPTWEGVGAVFLAAIIVLAILGLIYSVMGSASNTDLHRNFAIYLFLFYSLMLSIAFAVIIYGL